MPRRADDDVRWLIIYVILSRVRSLSRLRSVGLTPKIRKIIEGGPPTVLAKNFETLFRKKINNTKKAAETSKAALGWDCFWNSTCRWREEQWRRLCSSGGCQSAGAAGSHGKCLP